MPRSPRAPRYCAPPRSLAAASDRRLFWDQPPAIAVCFGTSHRRLFWDQRSPFVLEPAAARRTDGGQALSTPPRWYRRRCLLRAIFLHSSPGGQHHACLQHRPPARWALRAQEVLQQHVQKGLRASRPPTLPPQHRVITDDAYRTVLFAILKALTTIIIYITAAQKPKKHLPRYYAALRRPRRRRAGKRLLHRLHRSPAESCTPCGAGLIAGSPCGAGLIAGSPWIAGLIAGSPWIAGFVDRGFAADRRVVSTSSHPLR